MAGVTAPVTGSTARPAWAASVSMRMARGLAGAAGDGEKIRASREAQHGAVPARTLDRRTSPRPSPHRGSSVIRLRTLAPAGALALAGACSSTQVPASTAPAAMPVTGQLPLKYV